MKTLFFQNKKILEKKLIVNDILTHIFKNLLKNLNYFFHFLFISFIYFTMFLYLAFMAKKHGSVFLNIS